MFVDLINPRVRASLNKSNRNEPSNLNHIANEIAFLMEVDEDSLRKETYENSVNFFDA